MIFRLGELFCGPGGIAKGVTTANINNPDWRIAHQWANDITTKIHAILIFVIFVLTGKNQLFKEGYSYGKSLLI